MRQIPELNETAIVITTAWRLSEEEYQMVMQKSQADRLIYRPTPMPDELRDILEDVIDKRRRKVSGQQDEAGRAWVLIDDNLFHDLLIVMLERFGWEREIRDFTTGSEAMQWLEDVREGRDDGPIPELVISSNDLDGPGGLDVCRALRQIPELADTPFLLIGVRFRPEVLQEIETLTDGFLCSPFSASDFKVAVESLLKTR